MKREEIRSEFEALKKRLAPEWQIDLVFALPAELENAEDNNAVIGVESDYLRATLYMNPAELNRPKDDIRRTLAHELLHALFHDLDAVDERAARQLGAHVQFYHEEVRRSALERLVDRLAVALVTE